VSLRSLSIGLGIIFTTNESIDRIRILKSNASRFKENLYKKKCAAGQMFYKKKMRRRQDLSNKMRCRPGFLTKS